MLLARWAPVRAVALQALARPLEPCAGTREACGVRSPEGSLLAWRKQARSESHTRGFLPAKRRLRPAHSTRWRDF